MSRPKQLDTFSGEFGAGMGYYRAGFDVYGIDNDRARAKRAPFPIHIGDAIEALTTLIDGRALDFTHPDGTVEWLHAADFDAKHGSPPCTGYTRGTAAVPGRLTRYDRLIAVTRELFQELGGIWVIENVEDAAPELVNPLTLCGTEFGLTATDTDGEALHLRRHRLFESSVFLVGAGGCFHPEGVQWAGAYGGARRDKVEAREERHGGYVPRDLDVLRSLLGTPWMSEKGCFLSIPPAYTEFIGAQLIDHIAQDRTAA